MTGGAIGIGLLCGDHFAMPEPAKSRARELAIRYYRDFVAEFGTADCSVLTGTDHSTPEGRQAFRDAGLKDTVCTKLVVYAVRRLLPLAEEVRAMAGGTAPQR